MDFTIAADLATYSAEDLAAKITEGRTALDGLLALEDPTDSDVAAAEKVAEALAALDAESTKRTTAATDRASRMAALRETAATKVAEPEAEVVEEEEVVEEVDEVEPEAEVKAEDEKPAPAAKTSTRATLARRVSRPVTPQQSEDSGITIIASADVPGFGAGTRMGDLDVLTEGVLNRMAAFPPPAGIEGGQMQRYPVARLRREFSADMRTDGGGNDQKVIDSAALESRLPGGSLVASGGWCAPSETLYDLCGDESTEGIISLPEIQVNRGGIRYTTGPDFATIYTNTGFTQTEAQAIAGTAKPCYEVPCPSFTEVRLDATGVCIKAPILTNAGYPELVRRVIAGALVAQQFKVGNSLIAKIVADATAVTAGSVGGSAANVLDTVDYLIEAARSAYRLPRSHSVEVILPHWARGPIRADLAMRTGVDLLGVTDQQINTYFSVRGAAPQYVYGLNDITTPTNGWPANLQVLVYPSGTYVKGTTDVINLDAVYDAASLSANLYTALFVEEGVLLAKRCYGGYKSTITLCAAGITGAASNTNCLTGT